MGKITYESWVAMGQEARSMFLQTRSQNEISELLEDVHPELRLADLDSKEWKDLMQRAFELGMVKGEQKIDDVEILRTEVSSYGDYQNIKPLPEAVIRDVRQDRRLEKIIYHESYIKDPGYNIYKILHDFEGCLVRLLIQPDNEKDPNAYKRCITHFLTDENSMLFEKYPASYVSVSYHFQVEGDTREFTFKKPPSDESFEKLITSLYTNTENYDLYWKVTYNVFAIYINIVSPYGGGGVYKNKNKDEYYIEYKSPSTYPNSCFYQCIRKMRTILIGEYQNKKQTYEKMRIMLTDNPEDIPVKLYMMSKAENVFNVKFVIIGPKPPILIPLGYESDGSFVNTRFKYNIIYDYIYSSDIKIDHSETFEHVKNCMFLNKNCTRYGIIMLKNSHYHMLKDIRQQMFCKRCGSKHHTIEMSDKNEHHRFQCLNRISTVLNNDEIIKWTPKNNIIFYDFETVSHNRLIPYSVSWAVNKNKVENKIGMHIEDDFIDIIREMKGENILVAYFGSTFDAYFLLDAISSRGIRIDSFNTIVHNNRILKMQIGSMKTWDLGQFTKCSLNEACKSFDIEMEKLEYDFKEIQQLYEKYGKFFINKIDTDKTQQYNSMDVIMLRELFNKVRKTLMELTEIDPIQCLTLNHLVYKFAKRDWKNRGIVVNKMPIEYDDIFSSIPGGRCEVVEKGIFRGDYVLIDKNSLYPHVCLKYEYPNGKFFETTWDDRIEDIYLSECIIDQSQLWRKYAGVKTETGVDWTQNQVTAWLWKEEIEYLLSRGDVGMQIGRTIVWKERVKPFEALRIFINRRKEEESKNNPNKAMITMCKLCFNGFTGKMIQKNIDDIWTYVSSPSDVHRFVEKYGCTGVMRTSVNGKYVFTGKKPTKEYIEKPRHWGCRIYGLSHLEMYRDLENITTMKYGDTDSALIESRELDKIKLGSNIGEYKIEHKAREIAVTGKKSYCMVGERIRYRLKGYMNGDKWEIIDKESNTKIREGDKSSLLIFDALASDKHEVYTYQTNIVKNAIRKRANGEYEMFTVKQEDIRKKLV